MLAESVIGLYKTEVIRKDGPWKGVDDVDFATLHWVSWFNDQRLLGACRELAPSKQEPTTYEPSLVCKLLILCCRLLMADRLLGPIGDIPPAAFEQMYYQQQQARLVEAGLN